MPGALPFHTLRSGMLLDLARASALMAFRTREDTLSIARFERRTYGQRCDDTSRLLAI